jgi:hypothetical protein
MQLQTFQNQAHHPSTIGLSNINNSSSWMSHSWIVLLQVHQTI